MINGAHAVLYSTDSEADRKFLRDVLKLPGVDVGGGWLIFGLPPAEVAVHPGENDVHELYFMCDDIEAFVKDMQRRGVACSPRQNPGWGLLTHVKLPGGGSLGVYQPRHARPPQMRVTRKAAKPVKKAAAKRVARKPLRSKSKRR